MFMQNVQQLLDPNWWTTNWPLAVALLLLGFILGWLLTGIAPRRRASALEERTTELEGRVRKTDRDLADARKQAETALNRANLAENDLNDARTRIGAFEKDLAAAGDEKAGLVAMLGERESESTALREQVASLVAELDNVRSSGSAEANELRGRLETALAESAAVQERMGPEFDAMRENSENATRTLASKEAALVESFGRIADLQRELQGAFGQLTAKQNEVDSLRNELMNAVAMRTDLESKLGRAREDVAAEMATLTSTMLKMKDDALREANARISVLSAELDTQRRPTDGPQA
jgi:chromosome segregation ATPase